MDSILGGTLGGLLQTGANLYGTQNAAEAQTTAENAGITTQQNTMGNINSLFGTQTGFGNSAFGATGGTLGLNGGQSAYSPYTTTGAGASNQLSTFLGLNGQPADPNAYLSTPGYQTAVSQGTQAIQRAATANGSAYTPQTMANIGSYVTNTADQFYQNYLGNLQTAMGTGLSGTSSLGGQQLTAAGLGSTANQSLSGAQLQTGSNISQLQQNTGNAQASQYGALGGNVSSLLSGLNSSGALSSIGSGIGNLATGIGSAVSGVFGGGTSPGANTTGQSSLSMADPSLSMTSTPYSANGYATGDLNQLFTPTQSTGNIDLSGANSSGSADFWD